MPGPALRTRIRVRFVDGTVFELDRDPDLGVGDLIPPSMVGAFWAAQRKLLIKGKTIVPSTDIDPGEIRYMVEPLNGPAGGPSSSR